jgi:hypothetical protein
MSMNADELRARLSGLHELLVQNPSVDDESRRLLRSVVTDIERVLDSPAGAPAMPAAAVLPVTHGSRVEQLANRFEADHPSITGALRQLADLLGKAGI